MSSRVSMKSGRGDPVGLMGSHVFLLLCFWTASVFFLKGIDSTADTIAAFCNCERNMTIHDTILLCQ